MPIFRRRHGHHGETELNALIQRAGAAYITTHQALFDSEASLAEIYRKVGLPRPASSPPSSVPSADAHDTAADHPALAAVLDHVEMVDALLATVTKTHEGPISALGLLRSSRTFLAQLNSGLLARRLDSREAERLIGNVEHGQSEASKVLRHQEDLPVQESTRQRIEELLEVCADVGAHLRQLHAEVRQLFDDADEPAPLVPTTRR
jgi:hypothetical protein